MGTGLKPFEAKVQADTRNGMLPDADGIKAAAELLISPLPAQINVGMHGPGDGTNADPMELNYDASTPIRVQAHAQVFNARRRARTRPAVTTARRAPRSTSSGFRRTCSVTIGQNEVPATGGGIDHHTVIDFASDAPVGAKPDVMVNAIVGLPTTTPLVGSVPIRAHAQLLGLPRYLSLHMDEHVTNPGAANEQRDLQSVSLRTCQLNGSDACIAGTEDALDSLASGCRTSSSGRWTSRRRTTASPSRCGRPSPAAAKQFQAAVHLTNIREATYVNHQAQSTKGFRVQGRQQPEPAGASSTSRACRSATSTSATWPSRTRTLDAHANLLINPLPDDIRICLRESGKTVVAPTGRPDHGRRVRTTRRSPASARPATRRCRWPTAPACRSTRSRRRSTSRSTARKPTTSLHPAIEARKLHGELERHQHPDVDHRAHPDARPMTRTATPSAPPGSCTTRRHRRRHQHALPRRADPGDSVCQDPRPSATATVCRRRSDQPAEAHGSCATSRTC